MSPTKKFTQKITLSGEAPAFLTIGGDNKKLEIIDVSDGGISFLSNEKLEVGKKTEAKLHLPTESEEIDVKIKPTRCINTIPDGVKYKMWAIAGRFVS